MAGCSLRIPYHRPLSIASLARIRMKISHDAYSLYAYSLFQEKQARIAALYIPLLTIILEHAFRFHKNIDRPFIDDSLLSTRQHVISPCSGRASPAPSRNSVMSVSSQTTQRENANDAGNRNASLLPFDEDEKRELLICVVFLLKKLSSGIIKSQRIYIFSICLNRLSSALP